MGEMFFDPPILNSPYAYPARHGEPDAGGQPTQHIAESRRRAFLELQDPFAMEQELRAE
jgi:type III restriction enzyme